VYDRVEPFHLEAEGNLGVGCVDVEPVDCVWVRFGIRWLTAQDAGGPFQILLVMRLCLLRQFVDPLST